MKRLSSTFMQNGKPLEEGLDIALIFAYANKDAIKNYLGENESKLKKVNIEITKLKKSSDIKSILKLFFLPMILFVFSVLFLFLAIILGIILFIAFIVTSVIQIKKLLK